MENERRVQQKTPAGRYALLDELRGLDLVSMMLYHACWDMMFLFGIWMDWYIGWPGRLWQQSICWVFILLSGFCVPLGHRTLKRCAQVFAAGALVTVVPVLLIPEDVVLFGVLTLLGSAMGITALLEKALRKIPPAVGAVVSVALFGLTYHAQLGYLGFGDGWVLLPRFLYQNLFTAYLGFYPEGFFSTDYFPLVPWLFLFWVGFFLHHLVGRERMEPLRRSICQTLGWLGRHSLVVYLLHQPVLYGVLNFGFYLLR